MVIPPASEKKGMEGELEVGLKETSNKEQESNNIVSKIMGDKSDSIADTSMTPLTSMDKKGPVISKLNSKKFSSFKLIHKPCDSPKKRRKKKVRFRKRCIEFVEVESYKEYNKKMNYFFEDEGMDIRCCEKLKLFCKQLCNIY